MPLLAISAAVMGHVARRRNHADRAALSALIIAYGVFGFTVVMVAVWLAWSLAMTRSQ